MKRRRSTRARGARRPGVKAGSRFAILSLGKTKRRGKMNETETFYAAGLAADEDVVAYWFEPLTLRLSHPDKGRPATYTPDFLVLYRDGRTCLDDVKGSGIDNEAAGVRAKTAAELFPLWVFRIAKLRSKREGGGFSVREV